MDLIEKFKSNVMELNGEKFLLHDHRVHLQTMLRSRCSLFSGVSLATADDQNVRRWNEYFLCFKYEYIGIEDVDIGIEFVRTIVAQMENFDVTTNTDKLFANITKLVLHLNFRNEFKMIPIEDMFKILVQIGEVFFYTNHFEMLNEINWIMSQHSILNTISTKPLTVKEIQEKFQRLIEQLNGNYFFAYDNQLPFIKRILDRFSYLNGLCGIQNGKVIYLKEKLKMNTLFELSRGTYDRNILFKTILDDVYELQELLFTKTNLNAVYYLRFLFLICELYAFEQEYLFLNCVLDIIESYETTFSNYIEFRKPYEMIFTRCNLIPTINNQLELYKIYSQPLKYPILISFDSKYYIELNKVEKRRLVIEQFFELVDKLLLDNYIYYDTQLYNLESKNYNTSLCYIQGNEYTSKNLDDLNKFNRQFLSMCNIRLTSYYGLIDFVYKKCNFFHDMMKGIGVIPFIVSEKHIFSKIFQICNHAVNDTPYSGFENDLIVFLKKDPYYIRVLLIDTLYTDILYLTQSEFLTIHSETIYKIMIQACELFVYMEPYYNKSIAYFERIVTILNKIHIYAYNVYIDNLIEMDTSKLETVKLKFNNFGGTYDTSFNLEDTIIRNIVLLGTYKCKLSYDRTMDKKKCLQICFNDVLHIGYVIRREMNQGIRSLLFIYGRIAIHLNSYRLLRQVIYFLSLFERLKRMNIQWPEYIDKTLYHWDKNKRKAYDDENKDCFELLDQ